MFNFKIALAIVMAGILWTINIDLHGDKVTKTPQMEAKNVVQQ